MKKRIIIFLIVLCIIISSFLFLRYGYCYNPPETPPKSVNNPPTFEKDQKMSVFLKDNIANINKGVQFGVAFGIKNILDSDANFSYYINNIDNNCNINEYKTLDIIKSKKNFNVSINKNESYLDIIRFDAPMDFPNCIIQYQINADTNGTNYDRYNFSIDISKKSKFSIKTWFCQ